MLVLVPAALAVPAAADNGYEAKWLGQSAYLTLESGQSATSYFDAQNVGTATWTNDVVRLGTTNPRDRGSAFADSTWLNAGRATPLDQPFVEPGRNGRFTFTVRAPSVSATTVFNEYFAPVAELRGWMENNPENWWPNGVYLRYTVVPGQAPRVAIASAPGAVPQGTPVTVRATASDNRGVNRVEFALAGRAPVVDRTSPYEATLDSAGLPAGTHAITVRAVDVTGRTATVSRNVSLDPIAERRRRLARRADDRGLRQAAAAAAGDDPVRPLDLRARQADQRGRRTDHRRRHPRGDPRADRRPRVPRAAADLDRSRRRLRVPRAARAVAPDPRCTYTPFAGEQPAVTKLVRLKTRAGVRMRASRRAVRPGGRVAFRGRLKGGHVPRRGVLVVLQGEQRGFGWRTFKTVRARRGRFAGVYRFVRASSGTAFRFRAVVREQPTYPWATGRSRPVTVRLR